MKSGKKFGPGQYFLARISPSGYVVGLVLLKKSHGMLAAFFGDIVTKHVLPDQLSAYEPSQVILYAIVSTLGIESGFWPLIEGPAFEKDRWPLPWFGQFSEGSSLKIRYDSNPFYPAEIVPCADDEARRLPTNGVYGYVIGGYEVEKKLGKQFFPEPRPSPCIRGGSGMDETEEFLRTLAKEGVSLSKPLLFSFYVYLPTRDLVDVEKRLSQLGYEVSLTERADEPPLLLTARRLLVPAREAIVEQDEVFKGLASELGGTYDYYDVAL